MCASVEDDGASVDRVVFCVLHAKIEMRSLQLLARVSTRHDHTVRGCGGGDRHERRKRAEAFVVVVVLFCFLSLLRVWRRSRWCLVEALSDDDDGVDVAIAGAILSLSLVFVEKRG